MKKTEFDHHAKNYKATVQESIDFMGLRHDFFTRAKTQRILNLGSKYLSSLSSIKALDVGCGVGEAHPLLTEGISELHGVDISEDSIRIAQEQNPSCTYQSYPGDRLPYQDSSFDLVFTICVMHHVTPGKWGAFLREMHRVAKPSGLVVVFEHNPYNPLTRQAVSNCAFDKDATLFSMTLAKKLFKQASLEPVAKEYLLFLPFAWSIVPLLERYISWLPLGAQYFVAGRKA